MDRRADRPAQHDVRRPRRPDPAGDPGPPRRGRGIGQGPVRAVRHEPACDLQAPAGAGASGAHRAGPPGAVATAAAAGRPVAGRGGLGQPVPPALGGELRAARCLSPRGPGQAEQEGTDDDRDQDRPGQHRHDGDLLRDGDLYFERTFDAPREPVWKAFTDPELVPRWWGQHGTRPPSRRWTSGPAASGATSAARPTATTWPSTASTSRSRRHRLQVDLHVRRRRRRPAGRPGDLHPRGDRRQDEGHLRSGTWGRPRSSRGRSRPAWSAARSRRGIASRRCSPAADRPMHVAGHRHHGRCPASLSVDEVGLADQAERREGDPGDDEQHHHHRRTGCRCCAGRAPRSDSRLVSRAESDDPACDHRRRQPGAARRRPSGLGRIGRARRGGSCRRRRGRSRAADGALAGASGGGFSGSASHRYLELRTEISGAGRGRVGDRGAAMIPPIRDGRPQPPPDRQPGAGLRRPGRPVLLLLVLGASSRARG